MEDIKGVIDNTWTLGGLSREFEILRQNRGALENIWRSVLQLTKPNRALSQYLNNNPAGGSSADQLNSYARALHDNKGSTNSAMLASYLHSSLTNPHDKWFSLVLHEDFITTEGLNKEDIKKLSMLDFLTRQVHSNLQASNFHQAMYPFYRSLIDIGNSCVTTHKITRRGGGGYDIAYGNRSMFNVYFLENSWGQPDTVFCIYNWTASQICSFFNLRDEMNIKMKAGDAVYESLEMNPTQRHMFVHVVKPTDPTSHTLTDFTSKYFMYNLQGQSMKSSTDFLREEKLNSQPYMISRIRKEDGDVYGNGFSMEAYPLLIQLQYITKSITIGAHKNVEPPMNVPTNRLRGLYSTNPNAQNPVELLAGQVVTVSPTVQQVRIQEISAVKQELAMEIDKIYLLDKIALESVKYNRTGTEVNKRQTEEIKILSPFLGSLESEFLEPLVRLNIEHQQEYGGPNTQEAIKTLDNLVTNVRYTSDIAKAQLRGSVNTLVEMDTILGNMINRFPEIRKIYDPILFAQKIMKLYGGAEDTMKSKEEIDQEIQADAQAAKIEEAKQGAEIANQASGAMRNMAEAEKQTEPVGG